MKIITLMENTPGLSSCLFEHGLSLYMETTHHRMLVDTGASSAFLENAEKLKIDLTKVDTVILSHGHYDHAGGILSFAKINPDAKIYMQKSAGENYFHKSKTEERYIGIDPEILSLPQVVFVDGNLVIDEELELFSGIKERRLWPKGNLILKKKIENDFAQDCFEHEQYLVITCEDKKILISGCAHNGILNILDKYYTLYSNEPDVVISGFHMMKKSDYLEEDKNLIMETGKALKKTKTVYYTGHCTGEVPYQILKEILGDQIHYLHSGDCVCMKKNT